MTGPALTLGFETSCDETSVSVVRNGREVLSSVVSSQIALHEKYGGVVPEIAARRHIECVGDLTKEALFSAGCGLQDIDAVAATNGPGLAGALLVGLSFAKALAYSLDVPLAGVNHIEAHVCANYLNGGLEPPFLCLVASGGHTSLISVKNYDEYETVGTTRDDAAGEAFDKAARTLGLPYPGGPAIDEASKGGDDFAVKFPRARFNEGSELDFSFSGLKTAVLQYVVGAPEGAVNVSDVAASFQRSVVDALVINAMKACEKTGTSIVALAGGVASNGALRRVMGRECERRGYSFNAPPPEYCTDNAAMVACRGYYALLSEPGGSGYGVNIFSTGKK
ncbi:MAG: tRNA (adenosine(37)-N6)-threonylcarbamoyltransferase complex transferase subunit TsaD [Defluviitaleaceae bacterium]|nr:tRNA (adenosine(37)-N6)-threonylcarbamoyltransferase complex transferase subunit TsaD [Defluviitaleaceae bacterium]